MTTDNISFTIIGDSGPVSDIVNINEFISIITAEAGELWYSNLLTHDVVISNISINNNSAKVYSKWTIINNENNKKVTIDIYFELTKGKEWLINKMEWSNTNTSAQVQSLLNSIE